MDAGQPLLFTFANMRVINPPDISSYELATTGTKVNVQYWAHFDATAPPTVSSYEPPISRAKNPQKGSTMLIVYIIVSLIAAGFLSVMLFLGVKACKRYGGEPVQHLTARQRQSRARGIARAALDALPVVKFGSKPVETVPKDVEMQDGASSLSTMGSTMEQRPEVGQQITAVTLPTESGHRLESPISTERTNPPTGSPPTDTSLEVAEVPAASEPDPNQVCCPVCLDDFEEEQEVRVLPCSHSFHTDCIDPWLLNIAGSCPLCRIDLRSPEERERDNVANVLTSPPPALTTRPRSLSVRSGRLQVLLDVARRNSSREERLAALRAVREEPGNACSPRSRRPELGVSRLRRLAFGNARNGSGAVGENPSQRNGESIGGLVQGEDPHSAHPAASSIADSR